MKRRNPTRRERLAQLIHDTCADQSLAWGDDELADIFSHQMQAPLLLDLRSIDPDIYRKLNSWTDGSKPSQTFADVFRRSDVPLEIIELVKEFGKCIRDGDKLSIPPEIGTMLYFGSVAVAMSLHGTNISSLEITLVREGMEWGIAQDWIDEDTRGVFEQGAQRFSHENP